MTGLFLQREAVTEEQKFYTAHGAARSLWTDRSAEILLSGPAGTGKSRACLEKLWACANHWERSRILICRKTRSSLTETGLVTFEDNVVPAGHDVLRGTQRRNRQSYVLANGSEIIVRGLDDIKKIMSGEYDLIYLQEAIEATEGNWEDLTTRLRNGKMPFQQMIADTNPDAPFHWLNQRCEKGACKMYESRHEDNPTLFDPRSGQMTEKGVAYVEGVLDKLSGARLQRMRFGRWVQAEGVVYEAWDKNIHFIYRDNPLLRGGDGKGNPPASWTRYRVIDFGFSNPFVCLWFAEDPDGCLYLYRQVYRTRRLVEDHAKNILIYSKGERISATVADHDAEDRATLERHGIPTILAFKDVSPGIQAVQSRLALAGDGKPRLYVLRDSLVDADQSLRDAKQPTCAEEEFDSYVWPKGVQGRPIKEAPVKENDHAMDAIRYIVAHRDCKPRPGSYAAGGERPPAVVGYTPR